MAAQCPINNQDDIRIPFELITQIITDAVDSATEQLARDCIAEKGSWYARSLDELLHLTEPYGRIHRSAMRDLASVSTKLRPQVILALANSVEKYNQKAVAASKALLNHEQSLGCYVRGRLLLDRDHDVYFCCITTLEEQEHARVIQENLRGTSVDMLMSCVETDGELEKANARLAKALEGGSDWMKVAD